MPFPITARQVSAPNGDFADAALFDVAALVIDEVDSHVFDTVTNRHDIPVHPGSRRDKILPYDAGFGQAQAVDEHAISAKARLKEGDMPWFCSISFEPDNSQAIKRAARRHEPLENTRGGMENGNPFPLDPAHQPRDPLPG